MNEWIKACYDGKNEYAGNGWMKERNKENKKEKRMN